jgi:hypothetical protein
MKYGIFNCFLIQFMESKLSRDQHIKIIDYIILNSGD